MPRIRYNTDPNITLSGRLYNERRRFAEDVARALMAYATLPDPQQPLHVWQGDVCSVSRTGLGWVSVKVAGARFRVTIGHDIDDDEPAHTLDFDGFETPAGIAACHSWRLKEGPNA